MIHGFLKVAIASPEVFVADCGENTAQILSLIKKADEHNARIIVFPALSITGSTCGDLFLQELLGRVALGAVRLIAEKTRDLSITSIVGFPFNFQGSRYNAAAVIHQGIVKGIVPQKNISPEYTRYFSPPPQHILTIGEGLLGPYTVPFGSTIIFKDERDESISFDINIISSMHSLSLNTASTPNSSPVFTACLAAIPETAGSRDLHKQALCSASWQNTKAYLCANVGSGESTTDSVYSGFSTITELGSLIAESKPYTHNLVCTEIDTRKILYEQRRLQNELAQTVQAPQAAHAEQALCSPKASVVFPFVKPNEHCIDGPFTRFISPFPFIPSTQEARNKRCLELLSIQAHGLAKRLKHTKISHLVLGLSGGLDSTLALLVAVHCFDILERDRTHIIAITMPGFGTTNHTKNNGLKLARALGVSTEEIKISRAVKQHLKDIGHDGETQDITYENAQARERTQILMDKANMCNGLVLGTGNLSELALGWATYNGDHISMYAINASMPKTVIKEMVCWAKEHPQVFTNDEKAHKTCTAVLASIYETPISPELLPAQDGEISQKTEDTVGPYELHDFFIYHIIRYGCSPAKTLFLAEQAFCSVGATSAQVLHDAPTPHDAQTEQKASRLYTKEEVSKWLKIFYARFFSQQFKRSCMTDGPKLGSVCFSPREAWKMPSDASLALWKKELETLLQN